MRTVESLNALIGGGFWFLGSPYTECPLGRERAYEIARDVSLHLQAYGIRNYAPIVAGHYAACSAGVPIDDHEFWYRINLPFAHRARGLIVLRIKGWRESRGLLFERLWFEQQGKPAWCLMPSLALEGEEP